MGHFWGMVSQGGCADPSAENFIRDTPCHQQGPGEGLSLALTLLTALGGGTWWDLLEPDPPWRIPTLFPG
jgi:hypothetical protein